MTITEKQRRIYYQDIVYHVCNALDSLNRDNPGIVCGTVESPTQEVQQTVDRLVSRLAEVRSKLEEIVCTVGEDAGVVLLSQDGPTHVEEIDGQKVSVYDLEHFSPLGEALMAAWKLTEVKP